MFIWLVKTSSHALIGMSLAGLPATLARAQLEQEAPRWISSTVLFENANACMWAGVTAEICQAGYRSAYRQHVRIAPNYRDLADCEADFSSGECFSANAFRLWSPWLSGFALITQSQVSPPDHRHRGELRAEPNGGRQDVEPRIEVRYFSEPLYWESDHQGGRRLTSLREKLRNGEHFGNAVSRHVSVPSGSAIADRRLARIFEPQRVLDVSAP